MSLSLLREDSFLGSHSIIRCFISHAPISGGVKDELICPEFSLAKDAFCGHCSFVVINQHVNTYIQPKIKLKSFSNLSYL